MNQPLSIGEIIFSALFLSACMFVFLCAVRYHIYDFVAHYRQLRGLPQIERKDDCDCSMN